MVTCFHDGDKVLADGLIECSVSLAFRECTDAKDLLSNDTTNVPELSSHFLLVFTVKIGVRVRYGVIQARVKS